MLRQYPGRGNPVLDAILGRLSVRQLRVMVEGLAPDRVLQDALGFGPWLDTDWLSYDVSSRLRDLVAAFVNVHAQKGAAAVRLDPLPHPQLDWQAPADEEQLAAEAELLAIVNREE